MKIPSHLSTDHRSVIDKSHCGDMKKMNDDSTNGDNASKIISSLSVTSLCESGSTKTRTNRSSRRVLSGTNENGIMTLGSQSTLTSVSSSGFGLPVSAGASKATLSLYHVTFLTFMMVTLLFFIITIGASESENEFGVDSTTATATNQTANISTIIVLKLNESDSGDNEVMPLQSPSPTSVEEERRMSEKKDNDIMVNDGDLKNVSNIVGQGPSVGTDIKSNAQAIFNSISQSILDERRKRGENVEGESSTNNLTANSIISEDSDGGGKNKFKSVHNSNITIQVRSTVSLNHSSSSIHESTATSSSSSSGGDSKVIVVGGSGRKSDQNESINGFSRDEHNAPTNSLSSTPPIMTNGEDIKQLSGGGEKGGEKVEQKKSFNIDNSQPPPTSLPQADQPFQDESIQLHQPSEDWTSRILRTFGFGRFIDPPQNQTIWDPQKINGKNTGTKQRGSRSVCRISEFSCSRGKCVASDKFCNGVVDCSDSSDEPENCTPCNRTYYGEWGSTYSLSLSSETISSILQSQAGRNSVGGGDKKPATAPHFVCQLAFAATGDNFGDLVQIMFDSINIGQFSSSMVQGCPTGSLQIFEINRPITGGHWCGSGSGYSVYFSEMSAIVLTLSLGDNWTSNSRSGGNTGNEIVGNKTTGTKGTNDTVHNFSKWTSKGGETTVITSSQQQQNHFEFDFKIRYKFIPRSLAVVRYGLLNSPIERGALVPNTYCSRVLDTCHKTRCKIQSPNYPGLYPRNLTCYYTVRQREIPPCKRVLIQVTQMKPHKVQLRSIPGRQLSGSYSLEQSTNVDAFLAWEDCRGDRDSLIIYDGTSTNDPVLLKLCGGSYIPPITSSGPAILVAFHSTAFGNPLDPKPAAPFPSPLRGFELDVGVVIVDSESADYNNHHNCSFIFISSKNGEGSDFQAQEYGGNWITGKSGIVSSPRHTVPLNTTCRYEFRGNKHEAIWVYFVAYRRDLIKDSKEYEGNCTTRLRIWDGIDTRNNALLATYCDNELPRLCDHKALENETRLVRACTANESYISAGSKLIIEQQFMEGTALRPLHYQFNYEFVSRHAGTDGNCHRHYNLAKLKTHRGIIRTSDNVFDFGRGGKSNLTCTYTFTLPSYEGLYIKILNSSFGDRPCRTLTDFETGRYVCNETNENNSRQPVSASLKIYEEIWTNLNVTSHENCVCGNSSNNPLYFFTFLGRKVHLKFNIENMKSQDSYENFFVYFEYELKPTGCRGDNHYMKTESGMISLESSFSHGLKEKPPTCEHYPWIIEAREGFSLYLRVPGFTMIEQQQQQQQQQQMTSGNSGLSLNSDHSLRRHNNSLLASNMTMTYITEYHPSSSISTFENRLCPTTKNRIFIYDRSNKLIHKICPASNLQQMQKKKTGQIVEIYSEDFDQFTSPLYPPLPPKFIIEFIGRELGSYRIQWLEVMSAKTKMALLNMEKKGSEKSSNTIMNTIKNLNNTTSSFTSWIETKDNTDGLIGTTQDGKQMLNGQSLICPSYCPELNACISDKLWCDGEVHCPVSLSDEKSCDSFWLTISQLMSPAVYIPVAAAIVSALVCCGLVMLCLFLKRTVLNGHVIKDDGGSHTLERRLQRVDPHDPVS